MSAGRESAAGDAFTIFPPIVPRFWLAIPPVQLADMDKSENSRLISSCSRKSVYVHPAPMRTPSAEISIRRSSGKFQMLTSLRAGSFPAEYCTITSVPPAIGSHSPGSCARRDNTAGRFGGATNSYSAGWALTLRLPDVRLAPRLQRFACSRCSGKDYQRALRGFLPEWVAVFSLKDEKTRESFLEYRYRIGRRRNQEMIAATIASGRPWQGLRS